MPKRIQQRRVKGWRKPAGSIMVSRPSRYGNPFRVGIAVPVSWATANTFQFGWLTAESNADAVAYFRDWMNGVMDVATEPKRHRPDLAPLRGNDLGCYCSPDEPCHTDVLLELANRPEGDTGNQEEQK